MVDQSAVGHRFTPVTAHVEPGRLRYFLDTLGETNPVYRDAAAAKAAGYAATPMPPTYLFCLEMLDNEKPFEFLTALDIDLGRCCTASRASPITRRWWSATPLTFSPRVTSVTDKKGGAMTLIVVETAVTNQDGVHVADTARTIVVRNG